MLSINAKDLSVNEIQKYITGGIGPRPIALVSTLNKEGLANLSPFSFFNAFGSNPPTVCFSPARRGRDGSLKDTFFNIKDTMECTISTVSYSMVEQISLASTEYSSDIDEFIKSGLTKVKSDLVKPYGVAESPFWMECKIKDVIALGEGNGAGNLVIAEILMFHISELVLKNNQIDPNLADLVGRFGTNIYVRASGAALFSVDKPSTIGIGWDSIPEIIRASHILSANDIAKLANITSLATEESVSKYINEVKSRNKPDQINFRFALEYKKAEDALIHLNFDSSELIKNLEEIAKIFILQNKLSDAIHILLFRCSLNFKN
jgi:flavin reductase (DIM6/NTAB) family NADH-FMN oxidoreductase RutF